MRCACLYECSYEGTCHLYGMMTVGALCLPSVVCVCVSMSCTSVVSDCRRRSRAPHSSTVENSYSARAALTLYQDRIQLAQKCTYASYSGHERPPQVVRLLR